MINNKPTFQKIKYQLNILLATDDKTIIDFYKKFDSHHNGDSGIDLYNDKISIDPFLVGTIDFQMKCEMINLETNEYTSYYLVPRSSLAKTQFQLANSIGIIDAGYRGNLMAKIRNFNPKFVEILNEGSYFQIISPDLNPIKINIVNELSLTSRNEGSFGSTNQIPTKILLTDTLYEIKSNQNININDPIKINIDNINFDEPIYTLYFDGCCKGNPGKSGAGAVIYKDTTEIWSKSKLVGIATNNQAEYEGLILGLNGAIELNIKKLKVIGDSKLVINQLSGNYKIKSNNLIESYNIAKDKIKYFDFILFYHIERNKNKRADELANIGLNNILI